ncbi:hypothetical protein ACJQWK_01998 [Exserohilum turcicum]
MISTCLDLALLCHPVLALLTIQRPKMQTQQSLWQYFLLSFLSLLAVRYVSSTGTQPHILVEAVTGVCQTCTQPNPIAVTYPNNATGVLNGTISVVPISLALARKLIPPQYRILEHAYRHLLPSFPKDMYPVVVQAMLDHDIQAFGFKIPDFSRAGLEFPFLDLLGDNSTSFKWVPSLLITANNSVAIKGSADYGTHTFPATFDSACNAYSGVPDAKRPGTTTSSSAKSTDATTSNTTAALATLFSATTKKPYPISFFANVTNQVIFADAKSCDNQIRLFNTSLSTAPNKIEFVRGSVRAKFWPFDTEHVWNNVYGVRLATAFIENNYLPCENFRGYGS